MFPARHAVPSLSFQNSPSALGDADSGGETEIGCSGYRRVGGSAPEAAAVWLPLRLWRGRANTGSPGTTTASVSRLRRRATAD